MWVWGIAAAVVLTATSILLGNQRIAQASTLAQQIICLEYSINNNTIGGLVTLDPDQNCPSGTSTSTQPVLTVIKNVSGGTAKAGDFTMHVSGGNVSTSTFAGSTGGTIIALDAGNFSVSESGGPSGYAASFSDACDPNGSGTIADGDALTCIVTNTYTPPSADLSVTKTVDNATPKEGDQVTYTISVGNAGPDSALSVVVSDVLPAGLTFVATSSADTTGVYNSGTGTWSVGTLANGGSATLHITASVNSGTAGQQITNTATVSSDVSDPSSGNNSSSPSITVQSEGGGGGGPTTGTLVIAKYTDTGDDTFSFPVGNGSATTTEQITTSGGAGTTTVSTLAPGTYDVTEATSSAWTLDSVSCVYDGSSIGSGILYGEAVTLAAGDTITCTFRNLHQEGTFSDLSVTKTVDDNSPDMGQNVTYTITVVNNGPDAASNVVVTDLLPSGLTFVSTSSADTVGVYDSGTGTWTVGSLGNGASATLHVIATVDSDTNGETIINVASVTSDSVDDASGNDSGSASLTVNNPSSGGGGGNPTPTNTGGGGGGNGPIVGTFNSGGGGNGGIVLGASTTTVPTTPPTSCGALISTYMRRGFAHNDIAEVKKLQQFLNQNLGINLPITGYFGPMTEAAVNQFQQKYAANVLTPWGIDAPTGFVYLTTRRWINLLYCQSLSIPIPPLVPYSQR
jgi:uncharacterized repeat protein (TIGR01451 family)